MSGSGVKGLSDSPFSILVVDDDLDTIDSTATLLRMHHCDVRTADNGVDALSLAIAQMPDIVLADLRMPRMDGFELARKITCLADGSTPVLIAVSGMSSEGEVQKALAAGFHVHLTKPVDPKMLFEMVDWFRRMREM